MRFCPNCGRQLLDDAKFCDVCGERMPAVNSSPGPAEHADQTDAVPGGKTETAADETVPSAPEGTEKKPRKKAVLLGAIGAAALVAIALLAVFLAGGRKIPENFALFMKDNELYFTDFSKKGAAELTEDLLGGDALKDFFADSEMADIGYFIGRYAFTPQNGKRVFFPDRFENRMGRFSLSYLELDKASKGVVRIDGGIKAYTADAEGEHLLYLKGNSNALYYSDLASNFKIAENVASFSISEDGTKVFFVYDTGEGYFWYPDKDSVKVAADIEPGSIRHVSADLSAVYCTTKDSSLYKLDEKTQERAFVASGVEDVVAAYDTGEVYYTKAVKEDVRLYDYIIDDDATARGGRIREALQNSRHTVTKRVLYYYDGNGETALTDALHDYTARVLFGAPKPVLLLSLYEREMPKLRLSDFLYFYDAREAILNAFKNASTSSFICVGDTLTPVPQSVNLTGFILPENEDAVYFFTGDLYEEGDLYRAAIENGKVKTPKLVDADCPPICLGLLENGDVFAIKDKDVTESGGTYWWEGDLYVNGERVDKKVCNRWLGYLGNSVYYITGWSPLGGGTLKVYTGGKVTEVSDDVHALFITRSGGVAYLKDYNTKACTGTMCFYKDGKSSLIDEDVTAFLYGTDSRVKNPLTWY